MGELGRALVLGSRLIGFFSSLALGCILVEHIERSLLRSELGLSTIRAHGNAVFALSGGILNKFAGLRGNLRIAAGFQAIEQAVGRVPILCGNIDLRQVKRVALVAGT